MFTWVAFFFSSRRLHTRCALVTGVQTCALPIWLGRASQHRPLARVGTGRPCPHRALADGRRLARLPALGSLGFPPRPRLAGTHLSAAARGGTLLPRYAGEIGRAHV